jgi:peptide/nickel transport system substrate-binding protein
MSSTNNKVIFSILSVLTLLFFVFGCSNTKKQEEPLSEEEPMTRSNTLYVGGFQWGPPASFNPLAVSPAWPVTGNVNLIYEALFGYDQLDGKLKGIVGESFSIDDTMLTITINENARWQNGEPLTAEDVVYSYSLHKKYTTPLSHTWNVIASMEAAGTHQVKCILRKDNYNPLLVKDIIASVQVLPRSVFTGLEKEAFETVAQEAGAAPGNAEVLSKMREFKNDSLPVGSGPYTLASYSDDMITLRRIDSYWGNVTYNNTEPAPVFIVHKAYASNDEFNAALEAGDLDISQNFCPEIWKKFSAGVGTWSKKEPYYIPGIIPALLMSVTKKPFSDVSFRRAVAHAIDYEKIRTQAMFGYSPALLPGIILPFGAEKAFFSPEDTKEFGALYNPAKARKILKKAGYKWNKDGMLDLKKPNGEPVTLYATCPKGWTDWEATINIAVEGMRAVGISVEAKFVAYPEWDGNLKNGLFDFTMKTPLPEQAASLPWSRFDQVLSSHDLLPVGEVMFRNEGRYKNEKADQLLVTIPKLKNPEELKKAYREFNRLFMSEMPIIPLMYRPWFFYQFSTKHWTNFPTEENPYAPPQCLMVGAGVRALWGIKSVAK